VADARASVARDRGGMELVGIALFVLVLAVIAAVPLALLLRLGGSHHKR
jgi:hypothetical protein